jgi:hypothetical protein
MVPVGERNVSSIFMHVADLRSALGTAGAKLPAAGEELPELIVFGSAKCGPCKQFTRDYESTSLGASLRAAFRPRFIDVDRDPVAAAKYSVTSVPLFVCGDLRISGYTSAAQLLEQLAPAMVRPYSRDPGAGGDSAAAAPIPPAEASPAPAPEPAEADYGAVSVAILVKRQDLGLARGAAAGVLERMAQGPVERRINEALDDQATVQFVFERSDPGRYHSLVQAAGLPDKAVCVLVLVGKRFEGTAAAIAEAVEQALAHVRETQFADAPVEVLFQRADPGDYDLVRSALVQPLSPDAASRDPPQSADDRKETWWQHLLAGLVGSIQGFWTKWRGRSGT